MCKIRLFADDTTCGVKASAHACATKNSYSWCESNNSWLPDKTTISHEVVLALGFEDAFGLPHETRAPKLPHVTFWFHPTTIGSCYG